MEERLFAESRGNPSPMRSILTVVMHESSHSIHPRKGASVCPIGSEPFLSRLPMAGDDYYNNGAGHPERT